MVVLKKSIIFRGFRGSDIFQGGPTFSRRGEGVPSANFYRICS